MNTVVLKVTKIDAPWNPFQSYKKRILTSQDVGVAKTLLKRYQRLIYDQF